MIEEELIIDETNFSQYFRDCRNNTPERGDVMARYTANAEFMEGQMKRDIIDLLHNKDKAFAATQVMKKLGCATQIDSVRVCKEICNDIASGMTLEEVEKKSYFYDIEIFYYTKKEFIPVDNPHWCPIGIANLDEFLDIAGNKIKMKTKIIENMDKNNVHSSEDFDGNIEY